LGGRNGAGTITGSVEDKSPGKAESDCPARTLI